MKLKYEQKNKTLILKIKGELDLHTADDLRSQVDVYLNQHDNIKNMIMDLQGIDFIDSSGLGVILGRYKLVKQRGGKLAIISSSYQVKRIFEVSGMLKIISIYETLEQAKEILAV
ncbi:MAG: anti-sigma F factor antagonist [Desulfovibrionales bacterium]|nr:anti-sigma F factor antagonist [Desulfovibrionales bacterium]